MINDRQALVRLSRVVTQSLEEVGVKLTAASRPGGTNVEQLLKVASESARHARIGAEMIGSMATSTSTTRLPRTFSLAVSDTIKAVDELQAKIHGLAANGGSPREAFDKAVSLATGVRAAARNLPDVGGADASVYWTELASNAKAHMASVSAKPYFAEPGGADVASEIDSIVRTAQNEGASYTHLRSVSTDMVDSAHTARPVFGRQDEIGRIIEATGQRDKPSVVLSGLSGAGKTKIVEGLAAVVAGGEVPTHLKDAKLFKLDPQALLRGANARGELESRIGNVVNEVIEARTVFGENPYVVLDNIGDFAREDMLGLIKPSIADGSLPIIATGDAATIERMIEGEAQLARQFTTIPIDPLGTDDALNILRGAKGGYESHFGVRVTDDALDAATRLAHEHSGKPLPDSAVELIDATFARTASKLHGTPPEITSLRKRLRELEVIIPGLEDGAALGDNQAAARAAVFIKERAGVTVKLEQFTVQLGRERSAVEARIAVVEEIRSARANGGTVPEELQTRLREANTAVANLRAEYDTPLISDLVDEDAVRAVATRKYGVSLDRAKSAEAQDLLKLDDYLRNRVFGQDAAIQEVAEAVRIARMGLKPPGAPQGNFLFIGPTGVGKTELARALSERLYGTEKAMTRFDMEEFGEKHTAARLLGAPPGYAGFEQGGELTNAIRRKPSTLVLFDEIEKAHPDVPQSMLGYLEDGHLTDGQGRETDASNVLNIFTSNIQSEDELARHFSPEFLNRIDAVIRFDELEKTSVEAILEKNLGKITAQAGARGANLELTPAARSFLLDAGFDPALGGRPMNRAVKRHVARPLANEMLRASTTRDLDPSNPITVRLTHELGDHTLHVEGGARPVAGDTDRLVDVGAVVRGAQAPLTAAAGAASVADSAPPLAHGNIRF